MHIKYWVLLLIAVRSIMAQVSPCDLNADGKVDVVDVQLAINQSMGAAACTNGNLAHDGCTATDVQIVTTAALGGACTVTSGSGGASTASVADTVTIYEADGINQSGRAVTFGRAFVQGEFPQ